MQSPRIFLSSQTACKYWIHHDLHRTVKTRCVPTAFDKQNSIALLDARRFVAGIGDDEPLHISVRGQNNKHPINYVAMHQRVVDYPVWSFRKISRDVFVACPELCFLEAAQLLSRNALILYGMELCGTYARMGITESPRYKRPSLTSAGKIAAYLDKSKGVHGVREARAALKYVMDGSASPRESVLAVMMSLPTKFGGFGLPKPELNYGIEVDLPSKVNFGKRLALHGDIVWRDANLVVEYDGAQHGMEDNHVVDKQRDHLLLDAGFEVVRFTDKSLRSGIELTRLARTINRKAHLRRTRASLEWTMRRAETLDDLLFRSDPPWL